MERHAHIPAVIGLDHGARRMQVAAGIALAAHALVFALVSHVRRPAIATSARGDRDEIIVPIEAIDPPTPPPAPTDPPVTPPAGREDPAPRAPRAIARRTAPAPENPAGSPPPSASSEPVAGSPPGGDGAVASGNGKGGAPGGGDGDGSGNGSVNGVVGAPSGRDLLPPPLVPRAISAPPGVFGEVSAQDSQRVTSAGSALKASVFGAAEAKAPQKGTGTIRIEIGANGEVTGVTSTSPSWEAVAREAARRLAGRRLHLPDGAKGIIVSYAVSADATNIKNYLQGDPRVLVPCGTAGNDGVGRLDAQANVTCFYPGVSPRMRMDVSIKLLGEQILR